MRFRKLRRMLEGVAEDEVESRKLNNVCESVMKKRFAINSKYYDIMSRASHPLTPLPNYLISNLRRRRRSLSLSEAFMWQENQ